MTSDISGAQGKKARGSRWISGRHVSIDEIMLYTNVWSRDDAGHSYGQLWSALASIWHKHMEVLNGRFFGY